MRNLTLIRNVEWTAEDIALACDFDSRHRLSALLQTGSKGKVVKIDGAVHPVPSEWAAHVKRIRWIGDDEVVLWPVCLPKDHRSYVGKIGPTGTSMLDIGYPLDLFTDQKFIVCTYPEELIIPGSDLRHQSDLIAAFLYPENIKLARFIDPFTKKFDHTRFMEVYHGSLDGRHKDFWFTAYDTEYIWCFSFDESEIRVCPLRCALRDILAVGCNDGEATVIFRRADQLFSRMYLKNARDLVFTVESEISATDDIHRLMREAVDGRGGVIVGLTGGRIAVTTRNRAVLAAF